MEQPLVDKPVQDAQNRSSFHKYVRQYKDALFKDNYDSTLATYVLVGAVVIAINTGFLTGVCMSPYFLENSDSNTEDTDKESDNFFNPATSGVSGVGGPYTFSGMDLVEGDWKMFSFYSNLILSYLFGSFIPGLITPRAHKHVPEPYYGPTFFLAALCLLASSLLGTFHYPSRFIFFLAACAVGIQNGVVSIYSDSLIRPTFTGATTDVGLMLAQSLRGNYSKFIRCTIIAVIVVWYWIGAMISVPVTRAMNEKAIYISVGFYVGVALLCTGYSVHQLKVPLSQALLGNWTWITVVNALFEDDEHTEEKFLALFDKLDIDGNNLLEVEELRRELKQSKAIDMTEFKLRALMRAADANHDNCIDREEWHSLAKQVCKS